MAIVESIPAFLARCNVLGISIAESTALRDANYSTFGSFAFMVPFSAGVVDDALLKASLTLALGAEPDVLAMGKFRRLHFESQALVLQDTKSKIERSEESAPRRLPMPERAQRHEDQVKRLSPGVVITEWNEPSFALLDLVQQQMDDSQLKYVAIEQCTCRMQELAGVKKESTAVADKAGFLKIGEREAEFKIECGTDMFKVRQALLRRSLAYDQSGIIHFATMEGWHSYLFETLQRDPAPGYRRTNMSQVLLADSQIFIRMIELCRKGLTDPGTGDLPADKAMQTLMHDARITTFLLALPDSGRSSAAGTSFDQGQTMRQSNRPTYKEKRAAAKAKTMAAAPYQQAGWKGGKGKGKSNSKGKGKGKASGSRPPGLENTWTTHRGAPMCDLYNLGNCPDSGTVAPGSACSRGIHVCCVPFCGDAHPYHQCPRQ